MRIIQLEKHAPSLLGTYEGYLGGVEHPRTQLGAKLASEIDHTTPRTLSGAAACTCGFVNLLSVSDLSRASVSQF